MKELSIEQKAKAYDNVREKIAIRFGSNIAEEIFSEFEESEDERIRKALKEYFINSFQNNGVAAICGVHIKDILAFLKKQGEQKPAEWNTNDEQMLNSTIKDLIHPCYEEIPDRIEEEIKWIKSMRNRVVSQPKQEWSEEDENRFRNLIYLVEHSDEGKGTKEGFVKFIYRLKSLRPQNTWKPSDEQMYNLSEAAHCDCVFFDMEILKGLYDELKKL